MAHWIVGDHSADPLGIPALNDAERNLLGSAFGFVDSLLDSPLSHEIVNPGAAVGIVLFRHQAAVSAIIDAAPRRRAMPQS
jgi:hypothetical protein